MVAELYKDHDERLYQLGYESGIVTQKLNTIKLIREEMNRVYERANTREAIEALTYIFDTLLNANGIEEETKTEVKKYDA